MEITEDKLHFDCYMWFHNSFPNLRGLLCYNLNNSRNRIQASMDKGKGLQKGRSDLVFYYSGKAYMIELKIDEGRQSKYQKEWEAKIKSSGFDYTIIRSLQEFKDYINGIITI